MDEEKMGQDQLEKRVRDVISITVAKNYLPYGVVADYFYHSVTYRLLKEGILNIPYGNKEMLIKIWHLEWKMDAFLQKIIPRSENKMVENTRVEIRNSLKRKALLENIEIEVVYEEFLQQIASHQRQVKKKVKEWNVKNEN